VKILDLDDFHGVLLHREAQADHDVVDLHIGPVLGEQVRSGGSRQQRADATLAEIEIAIGEVEYQPRRERDADAGAGRPGDVGDRGAAECMTYWPLK
jgi:hypothetical protein